MENLNTATAQEIEKDAYGRTLDSLEPSPNNTADQIAAKLGFTSAADLRAELDSKQEAKKEAARTEEEKAKDEIASISLEDQVTFWNYLNDTQIGVFNPDALTKLNTWLVTHDGTWLIQKNKSGYFASKKSDNGIPTLPKVEYDDAFFELKYGKIPHKILDQIVTFFRQVMNKYSNGEAFLQIYWDLQQNEYVVHVPKQTVSQASVRYDATANLDRSNPERYVFVYECHSHNTMNAFWSGTDNADEKELRLYGVFGCLNKVDYMTKHRFFVGEEEIDVSLDGIFEMPTQEEMKSVITVNKKEFLVSNTSLTLDEKPRYIYKDKNGQVAHIAIEQVKPWKPVVDVPESWIASINKYTPPVTTYTSGNTRTYAEKYASEIFGNRKNKNKGKHFNNIYSPRSSYRDHLDDDKYASGHYDGYDWVPDETMSPADQEYSELMQAADFEIEEALTTLEDHTNGFEDIGSVQLVMEAMERKQMLIPFVRSAQSYLGEYVSDLI